MLNVDGSAARAGRTVRPNLRLEPRLRCAIIEEHAHKLLEADAFAVRFARSLVLGHAAISPKGDSTVVDSPAMPTKK